MLYRLSSFRKSSRAVTAVAAVGLFVTASFTATSPAQADEANKYIAACAHLKDSTPEHAGCIYSQMDRQTRDLKRDTARLKAEEVKARAEQNSAEKDLKSTAQSEICFDFLKKGRDDKKFTREAVLEAAGGRLTPDIACKVALKFGYGQRASADAPRFQ